MIKLLIFDPPAEPSPFSTLAHLVNTISYFLVKAPPIKLSRPSWSDPIAPNEGGGYRDSRGLDPRRVSVAKVISPLVNGDPETLPRCFILSAAARGKPRKKPSQKQNRLLKRAGTLSLKSLSMSGSVPYANASRLVPAVTDLISPCTSILYVDFCVDTSSGNGLWHPNSNLWHLI